MPPAPEQLAHQEWLGYVQPVGLVASIPALLQAQAYVNRNAAPLQQKLMACLPHDKRDQVIPEITDFTTFSQAVLDWLPGDLVGAPGEEPVPAALEIAVPEYHETLRPTYALREPEPQDAERPWQMLIQLIPLDADLDEVGEIDQRHWQASPQAKFERLLRETQVPIGLLINGRQLRLVYAPRGETSGHITFPVAAMTEVAGRPILAAMHMLLSAERLFTLPERQRLPAILADSRKYQNVVSTKLAEQVLAALYELVRGFQAANDQAASKLLAEALAEDPNHVYAGLLTVLMRLVFVLYAEDRGLLSADPVFANYYSLAGLFDRLRTDAGRYPDTMDQRYGAWAQLLTLFRLIYDGGSHGALRIPPRRGYLFDPDRYPFLEGRPWRSRREPGERLTAPRLSDGVLFRVLSNLLVLDGERLSYRTLDVEQIGSVYETMVGFDLEVAGGRSIAIKPSKAYGAPATINLEALLAAKPAERAKWFKEQSEQSITGQALSALKDAMTIEELLAALDRKIAHAVTPQVVSKGAMVLQPSDERRRSGSHYTPRSLTEPIVRTTLRPVLEQLGPQPKPEQILDLKVCDPAMGSGAFLVEACRQLGDELVKAWHVHDCVPRLPPDEDEVLHARRLVAQRCLYGVDKNPMAVDLAKLSLWLATLAKEHPFTFVDHALRHGDSLVGLSRRQIAGFHWDPAEQRDFESKIIATRIERAADYRRKILAAREDAAYADQAQNLQLADESLDLVRLVGDAVVAAFFSADKPRARAAHCDDLFGALSAWMASGLKPELRRPLAQAVAELRMGKHAVPPFHWEIEFPEVFAQASVGFDAIVGNPPFAGKNTLIAGSREGYLDWLKTIHEEAHGNADVVAHFFRRAFNLLRPEGAFGLIATNTIGQGDTRSTGLRWICKHGGTIYSARKRYKWPGAAAVVVSVVHVAKGPLRGPYLLEGREVPIITAYLFHAGGHDDPAKLAANANKSFQGSIVLGMGFTFDDTDTSGVANPIAEMHRLIAKDSRNAERIFPYIGGEELNDSPTHAHHRYVINFGEMSEDEAAQWPDLMSIVEQKVKPKRLQDNRASYRTYWWQYAEKRAELTRVTDGIARVLVIPFVAKWLAPAFVPAITIVAGPANVIALSSFAGFAVLQTQTHELWVQFLSSSLEERQRYTPSDCFETFPFPAGVLEVTVAGSPVTNNQQPATSKLHLASLESAGREYYEFRAALMVRNDEGLTKTYNRFHDPDERSTGIQKLRELHAAMDHAVLEAYGWNDLANRATCEFLLDYEDDEEDDESPAPARRTRRKPWRYRWPDEFRDEVLARLLDLNCQRAEEERLSGASNSKAETGSQKAKRTGKSRKKGTQSDQSALF